MGKNYCIICGHVFNGKISEVSNQKENYTFNDVLANLWSHAIVLLGRLLVKKLSYAATMGVTFVRIYVHVPVCILCLKC